MKKLLRRALSVVLTLTLTVTMITVAIVPAQAGMLTNIVTGNFTAVAFELMERGVVTAISKAADKSDNETISEALSWTKRILAGYQSTVNAELLSRTQEISDTLNTLYTEYSNSAAEMQDQLNKISSKLDEQAYDDQHDAITTFGNTYHNGILSDFNIFFKAFDAYGKNPDSSDKFNALKTAYYNIYKNYSVSADNGEVENNLFIDPLFGTTDHKGYLNRISRYDCSKGTLKDENGEYYDMRDPENWAESSNSTSKAYLEYALNYAGSVYNFENNIYDFMVIAASEAASQLGLYIQAYRYFVDFNTMLINSDPDLTAEEKQVAIALLNDNFEASVYCSVRAINQMYYDYNDIFTTYMRSYDTKASIKLADVDSDITFEEAYAPFGVTFDADMMADDKTYYKEQSPYSWSAHSYYNVYQFKLHSEDNNILYTIDNPFAVNQARVVYKTHTKAYGVSQEVLDLMHDTEIPQGLKCISGKDDLTNIIDAECLMNSKEDSVINNIYNELYVYHQNSLDLSKVNFQNQSTNTDALPEEQYMIVKNDSITWSPDKGAKSENDAQVRIMNIAMPKPVINTADAEDDLIKSRDANGDYADVYSMYKGTPYVNVTIKDYDYYNTDASGVIETYVGGQKIENNNKLESSQAMTLKIKPDDNCIFTDIIIKNSDGDILDVFYGDNFREVTDHINYLITSRDAMDSMPQDDQGFYEFIFPVPCQDVTIEVNFAPRVHVEEQYEVALIKPGVEGVGLYFDGYGSSVTKRYLPGEEVVVSVMPKDITRNNKGGFDTDNIICDTIIVTDENGNSVPYKDITDSSYKLKPNEKRYSFTMPSANVSVSAITKNGYAVSVVCDAHSSHLFDNLNCYNLGISIENGVMKTENTEKWSTKDTIPFSEGEMVYIFPIADTNYIIKSVYVYSDEREVDTHVLADGTVSFEMPDGDVVVSIYTEEIARGKYTASITYSGGNSASFTDSDYLTLNTLIQRYNHGETVYFALENNKDAIVTLTASSNYAEDVKNVELNMIELENSNIQYYNFIMPDYSVVIDVENPLELSVDKTDVTVGLNDTEKIIATVTPEDASNKTIIWESANSDVATVEDGVIKGVGVGTTTVTATLDANRSQRAEIAVTVDYLLSDEDGSFIISNYNELCNMKAAVESGESKHVNGNYIVVNDIICPADENWSPITVDSGFCGTLDGRGFAIENLTIIDTNLETVALFETIGETGTVKNLSVENASLEIGDIAYAGVIAANNGGYITNCYTSGTIKTSDDFNFTEESAVYIGAISGENEGKITGCTSDLVIYAGDNLASLTAGGITAFNTVLGEISNCSFSGAIESYAFMNVLGGLTGMSAGMQTMSYNEGKIITHGWVNAGGISGYAYKGLLSDAATVKIQNCYNTGDIIVKEYSSADADAQAYYELFIEEEGETIHAGGMFGNIENTSVSGLYSCGNIKVKNESFYGTSGIEGRSVSKDNFYYLVADTAEVTDETQKYMSQFMSGEVAYLLNNGVTDGTQVWYQNLDNGEPVDNHPVFAGGTVYKNTSCKGNITYSNYDEGVVHNYNSYHVCKDCIGLRPGEAAGIYGFSIGLGGNISVQYYMVLDEDVAADKTAKMIFTVPDTGSTYDIEIPVSEAVKSGKFHIFECEVAAKEIPSDIYCQVVTDTRESDVFRYSVKEYAEVILANPQSFEREIPLVKALLNYGGYAQVAFDYNMTDLANTSANITEEEKLLQSVDFSDYELSIDGAEEGVAYYGSAISLKSETAIKHYFYFEDEENLPTVTVNGKEVTPVKNGGYYEVKISDISAHKLHEMYEVKVGGFTLNYGVFSYCYTASSKTSDQKLIDVANALHAYNQAAIEYIG